MAGSVSRPHTPLVRLGRIAIGFAVLLSLARGGVTDPGPVDLSTRESSRRWFLTWWPRGWGAPMEYTGDVANGIPGDTGQAWKDQQCLRINTYRRLAGLQPITFKPEYNAEAQAAATLCAVNHQLSHNPPPTWKFWTEYARDGCRHSLLGQNVPGSNTINGFIEDAGDKNLGLGHRIVLLDAPTKFMGTGDTPDSVVNSGTESFDSNSAIYGNDSTVGDPVPSETPDLILWPSPGFLPHCLLPSKWMAKIPDDFSTGILSFSGSSVSVTRNGEPLPVWSLELNAGIGITFSLDGTETGGLGWVNEGRVVLPPRAATPIGSEIVAGFASEWEDVVYHVVLSGIRVRATGALWKGTGVFEYDVVGYNHNRGPSFPESASLINVSTRSVLGSGSQVQIGGFVVAGSASRAVLLRAAGPSLEGFGLRGVSKNPRLSLWEGAQKVAGNDDWSSDPIVGATLLEAMGRVGAFSFSEGGLDAGLLAWVEPGRTYTAQVETDEGGGPLGLVEIYDADSGNGASSLVNLSSRSFVGKGERVQIGGFVLRGELPRTVLIRVSGPSLSQFSVENVLQHPHLVLRQGSEFLRQNDSWESDPVEARVVQALAAEVGAFAWKPGSGDAAVVACLSGGRTYTVVVDGADGGEGNALLEVYAVK